VILEVINSKNADFLHQVRTSDGSSLIQYAAKNSLDDVMSYLSVIFTHDELNAEDPFGFTPLLYYLFKEDFDMSAKLVFRGADVNHLYSMHGGKSAVAIMVEQKNDLAVKFLLDKLANPHLVFGLDNKDACDLAKENGLDKRFFAFGKCNGENKVFPRDAVGPITDHRKELAIATTDYKKILAEAKKLDQAHDDGGAGAGQSMDWIHDELRDGMDNYDPEMAKKYNAPYKSSRFDLIDNVNNAKKKVQDELEEYKQKFAVDEN